MQAKKYLREKFPQFIQYINQLPLVGHFGDDFNLTFPYRNAQGYITGLLKRAPKAEGLSGITYDGQEYKNQRWDSTPNMSKDDLFGLNKIQIGSTSHVVYRGRLPRCLIYAIFGL
jgi:hypothetical protein